MVFYLVKFAFWLRLLFYHCYYHINGEIKIYNTLQMSRPVSTADDIATFWYRRRRRKQTVILRSKTVTLLKS